MNAESISKALGGRKSGRGYMACCPAHNDSEPSLSICNAPNGKVLLHCHAGCDQSLIIGELRKRRLWNANRGDSGHFTKASAGSSANDAHRSKSAVAIWKTAVPAEGTPVEAYLRSRGLQISVPDSLCFRSGLKHRSGLSWPAMVALVTRGSDGTPLGIHRTFLARDGSGKAPVEPPKMMLGPCGGGVVRLAAPGRLLMVGEGIETSLAAMQATGYPAWAALSTSGLRKLNLPEDVRDVIILADGDDPGEAAAQHCARRWTREGRRVRIARPGAGLDFNDMLVGRHINFKEIDQ